MDLPIFTLRLANEHEREEEESNKQPKGDEPKIEEFVATNLHIHTTRVQIRFE